MSILLSSAMRRREDVDVDQCLVLVGRPGDTRRCIHALRHSVRLAPRNAVTSALARALDSGETSMMATALRTISVPDGHTPLNAAFVDDRHDPARYLVIQAVVLSIAGVPMLDLERVRDQALGQRLQGLVEARRLRAAFHPLAKEEVLDVDPRLVAIRRTATDGSEYVLCLHNVTDQVVTTRTGNDSYIDVANETPRASRIELQPYEVAWLHQPVIDLRNQTAQTSTAVTNAAAL